MKKILYIGNNLSKNSNYHSAMDTLSSMLIDEGFDVKCSSSKSNKILRLFSMCFSIIIMRKRTDFILIDTFSTTNFYYALITSQIARMFSIKYIPILHGGNLPWRIDNKRYFSNLIFKNSYKNISPSKYLQFEFSKRGYEVNFIPNAIEIKSYKFRERREVKFKILWVRAFEKTYNPLLAIKVLSKLKIINQQVELCMVGPEKDDTYKKSKELVNKMNLKENIKFTGVLPKEKWHRISEEYDIFLNTTNIDNMPVSIIEAMALGFPIISTNAGGLPYLIENEVNGLLVPINNENDMVESILELINNPNKAEKLSLNARKKALTFDMDIVKNMWLTILK